MEKGIIRAICLDVFESEKPFSSVLTGEDNFIGTPHIGAQTDEAQQRAGLEISKKVIEYLKSVKR